MKIRYLREVYSPHSLAGTPFSERDIEEHLGRQLIAEQYAEEVKPAQLRAEADAAERQAQTLELLQRPTGTLPEQGEPFPAAEAATGETEGPSDVIPEDDVDAT